MVNRLKAGIFYGWIVVAASCLILAVEWGCQLSYGVFLTELCQERGWSRAVVSGAYSLFFIWHTVIYFPAGRLNDRYGPRTTLMVSIIAVSGGYALMSIITAPWELYINCPSFAASMLIYFSILKQPSIAVPERCFVTLSSGFLCSYQTVIWRTALTVAGFDTIL